MKQVTNITKKQKNENAIETIRQRFQKLTDFIRTQPEEVIKTSLYSALLSDMDSFLNETLASMSEAPNFKEARDLYGNALNELLVLRAEFKDELALHDRTWKLSGREKKCEKKYSSRSHYYRMRTMKEEFGSEVLTSGKKYMTWKVIPDDNESRTAVNREIDQLLRQQSVVSKSLAKQQRMSAKYDCFIHEMEKRIIDCRHVLMITAMTDQNEKRERKAFMYLYEAVTYRKKLLTASSGFRQACMQMAI